MGRSNIVWSEIGHGTAVLIAFGLGSAFGLGVGLTFFSDYYDFGLYLMFHSFFHLWEYVYVALFHSVELSSNSFLINHSSAFYVAWIVSWSEYWLERWLFPSMKGYFLVVFIGLVLTVGGQAIRTLAMYTAGSNFHHLVRDEKEKGHDLVTFGVYQYLRHPAYFGWFWWSVGTQVLLSNPISIVLYGFAAFKFFEGRIPEEEKALISFFGDDYINYRKRTPVGIPGIH